MPRFKTDGEIVLRKTMHGTRWTGETIADSDTLRGIINTAYFTEEQYDSVLVRVSEYGYCLTEPYNTVTD